MTHPSLMSPLNLLCATLALSACNGPEDTGPTGDTSDTEETADSNSSETDLPDTDDTAVETDDTAFETDDTAVETDDTAVDTDVSDTGETDDTDVELTVNYAFITSTVYNGDLGGLAGADQKCQAAATSANLPGTYVALLNTNGGSAFDRLGSAAGWVRPDGKFVASDVADLEDGLNYYPIRVNEFGAPVTKRLVWAGDPNTTSNCSDWADAVGTGIFPQMGEASAIGYGYQSHVTLSGCSSTQALFCFGVDHTVTLAPPEPVAGRIAFFSQPFTVGGGIESADAQCQAEAENAGIDGGGTFLAALATTSSSIRSRFDTGGLPWVRVDGVPLAPTAAAFFDDAYWETAVNMLADGSQYGGGPRVWAGAPDMDTVGVDTCGDWLSTTGTANISSAMVQTALMDVPGSMATYSCGQVFPSLLCLQE